MNPSPIRLKISWLVAALALVSFLGLLGLAGFSGRAIAAAAATAASAPPAGGPARPPMPLFAMIGDPPHVDAMVDRLLSRADAGIGDDQREQLKAIFRNAAADLVAQRTAAGSMQEDAMKLFVAPNVDAREVEALRQKTMARQEETSRRVTQALVEASRVLTVDQRQKVAVAMASGPMGGPPHRPHPPAAGPKDAPADPAR